MTTLLAPPRIPAPQSVATPRAKTGVLPLAPEARIPALDGLRGIAVLSVIAFHWLGILGHHNPAVRAVITASHAGWTGVELFFALSGFLITGILYDSKPRPTLPGDRRSGGGRSPWRRYFLTFYARRSLRIFPLYYGVILALVILTCAVPALRSSRPLVHDQAWLYLYGVNVGINAAGAARFEYAAFDLTHFWSLAVEEHFYLLWPLVIYFLPLRRAMNVAAGVIFLSLMARVLAPPVGTGLVRGVLATPMSAGGLAAGALVALYLRSGVPLARVRTRLGWLALLGLVVSVGCFAVSGSLEKDAPPNFTLGLVALSVLFACLVGHTATGGHRVLQGLLTRRPLLTLGKYSYGLYVFHHVFSPMFRHWDFAHLSSHYWVGALAYLATATAVTGTCAYLSYQFYERPMLNLKSRVPYAVGAA